MKIPLLLTLCAWLRAQVVADAFTKQMEDEADKLRVSKQALEQTLASGGDLTQPTKSLEDANEQYRKASQAIRKHTTAPKEKPKAKAKARANGA